MSVSAPLLRMIRYVLLLPLLWLGGCGQSEPSREVEKAVVLEGGEQCALPGERFPALLRVEFSGAKRPGLLGGPGRRPPVTNLAVRLEPAPGSELQVEPELTRTDASGCVYARVRAGSRIGDHYLRVTPVDQPEPSLEVRFIVGMKITGAEVQAAAGGFTPEPLTVKLLGPDGRPAAGVPVFFRAGATAEGARSTLEILKPEVRTDARGEASTPIRLGSKTGEYQVAVEVADPVSGTYMRGKSVRFYGLDAMAVIVAVLGGLSLFIFGMKLMSDGLQKAAGESMKKILQFFSRNGVVAVLAGTVVTAVIQSSSATTVMVIGFINAGLLNLSQAIGIIFGANIGTTVTAQIISFNLTGLALPAITLGFLTTVLARRRMLRGWGETVLGFGVLFFGLNLMAGELKTLGSFPDFIRFFGSFDCQPPPGGWMPLGPVLGAIGIGIFMTVVVQSSSAAMGIVLALAGSGLINFYTSVPLLLGTNIGTTITAFLASLAANRVAKQAALAHTLFNLFGTLVMVVLFYVPYGESRTPVFLYLVNLLTPGNAFAAHPQNLERHIAMAHTLFNVLAVVLLLPFIPQFARLCNALLPIRSRRETRIHLLEPHLLATPSVALEQTVAAIRSMVQGGWKMLDRAVNGHFLAGNTDPEAFEELAQAEREIDAMQSEVTDYLVRITRRPLTHPQSELIPLLMHCTNDAERIADHAENILKLTERLKETGKPLSDQGRHDLEKLWGVLDRQFAHVLAALGSTEAEKVAFALKSERKINKLAARYESDHIERLRKGNCSLPVGVIFIEMLGELEKIGDSLSNIAERTPEIQKHYIKLQS